MGQLDHHYHSRRGLLRDADGHGARARARRVAALPAAARGHGGAHRQRHGGALSSSVLLAVLMQIGLAWCIYRTPLPAHPLGAFVAFSLVCFAFLGLGLIIAMLADAVPAVQALGQAIFLPMIMIGGVGRAVAHPAAVGAASGRLPAWPLCRGGAGCVHPAGRPRPGRRALCLGRALCDRRGRLRDGGAPLSLGCQASACRAAAKAWIVVALAAWVAVGWRPSARGGSPFRPRRPRRRRPAAVGKHFGRRSERHHLRKPAERRRAWSRPSPMDWTIFRRTTKAVSCPSRKSWAHGPRHRWLIPGSGCRNLLSAASVADVLEDPNEGAIGYVILDESARTWRGKTSRKSWRWIILHPDEGTVLTKVPELGVSGEVTKGAVRERSATVRAEVTHAGAGQVTRFLILRAAAPWLQHAPPRAFFSSFSSFRRPRPGHRARLDGAGAESLPGR